MIRPEMRRKLRRWRDMIGGAVVLAFGVWTYTRGGWILEALGAAATLLGLTLIWLGWLKARALPDALGPGLVRISEGRISYMGPHEGGSLAIDEIRAVDLVDGAWRLSDRETVLAIPIGADGADALLDAFLRLPGLSWDKLADAQREARSRKAHRPVMVWQKPLGARSGTASRDYPRLH
ncbi:hypothetical protein ACMA5I_02915 [Paracoccaceae bacterium GXU_MW_L88]